MLMRAMLLVIYDHALSILYTMPRRARGKGKLHQWKRQGDERRRAKSLLKASL